MEFKIAIRGAYGCCKPGFYAGFAAKMDELLSQKESATLVLDGDLGVSASAAKYARERDNVDVYYFEPDWQGIYGSDAGRIASRESVAYADAVVLFFSTPQNKKAKQVPSKGEIACMTLAKFAVEAEKPVRSYFVEFDAESNPIFNIVKPQRGQWTF